MEILPGDLPEPIPFASNRDFIRQTLAKEVNLSAKGTQYVDRKHESQRTVDYRKMVNAEGSPSEAVAAGYVWAPGTELSRKIAVAV
jgi:hypothetical protein